MSGETTHRGKRGQLDRWLTEWQVAHAGDTKARIGAAEWALIEDALAPISPTYLRRLLRDAADQNRVRLTPLVEGVRQNDFDTLTRSLTDLALDYEAAGDGPGAKVRRQKIRDVVIEGKDHARLSSRNPDKRAVKQEMLLWMLTWLENPPLFPAWAAIRRRGTTEQTSTPPDHGDTET